MGLPARRDVIAETQRRLEIRWCSWPGDWKSFIERVQEDGNEYELMVIDRWPDEFQTSAVDRANRVATWQENQLLDWLDKMNRLTEAEKTDKNGDRVADHSTRFHATKYLLDRALGSTPETPKPGTETGEALQGAVEEREKLRRILHDEKTVDAEFETREDPEG